MRHSFLSLSALCAAVSVSAGSQGCNKSLPCDEEAGKVFNRTLVSDGVPRSYLVFIPPTYEVGRPMPLILSYHGGLKTAEDQLELDLFTSPYFNNDSMVVYPQGIDNTWQGVPGVTTDDILFTNQILDEVESLYCIDEIRIAASGKSDGGGFVGNQAACDPVLSQRLAAVAPVSGAFYVDTSVCQPDTVVIPCRNRRHVPVFDFHGGEDPVINYNGGARKGECLPTIPHWITAWAIRDGLDPSNDSQPLAADTTIYSWGRGSQKGFVKQVTDLVIGHTWPSTQPNADNTRPGQQVASFNATPLILDFFQTHPLDSSFLAELT
ncbi:hypothetical protein ANO11243_034810 [Dothideomycetidae sp. 11243]|nr:hypothetical protein ANO11243_034810 [fungal sp. No.11243]